MVHGGKQVHSESGKNREVMDVAKFNVAKACTFLYTTLTNFSTKYLVMCKVYTGVGGIKYLYHVCPPVRKEVHSLKLVDYLYV